MNSESVYQAIPIERIRHARARLALEGLSVGDWAAREGFQAKNVYQVLSGRRMAIRGESLKIAIKLGLRDHPSAAPHAENPGPVPAPALAHPAPAPDQNRRPISQLGEAAR